MEHENVQTNKMVKAVAPKLKLKTPAKRARTTLHEWTFQQESVLIQCVEKRQALWNSAHPNYKLPIIKADLWVEVVAELDIGGIHIDEVRNKWNNLRSNFRAFLKKQRAKKSGRGAIDPKAATTYSHYDELMFIESTDVLTSSQSTSTLKLENAMNDQFFLDELDQVAARQVATHDTDTRSLVPIITMPRPRRPKTKATTCSSQSVPPSPAPSKAKETAIELLHSLYKRADNIQSDHFSAFGEFIAGRLRNLPSEQAEEMEMHITQTMYSCLQGFRAKNVLAAAQMDVPTILTVQSSHSSRSRKGQCLKPKIRPKPLKKLLIKKKNA